METEYKVLAGKGDRCILSHVGCAESRFFEICFFLFRGSKSSSYHTEMNLFVSSDWCESKLFPAMKRTMRNLS